MKNQILKISLAVAFLFIGESLFANEFTDALDNFKKEWVLPMFPIVAGIATIVGGLINASSFFGESRDIKKGFINILVWPAAVAILVGVYTGVVALAGSIS